MLKFLPIFFSCFLNLYPFNPDSLLTSVFQVDSIIIIGNQKTERDIILRELTFTQGDTVDQEVLNYNRERVFSLGLFTNVRIRSARLTSSRPVIIAVNESWYIWPIPFVNFKDNDLKKATAGLNLLYKNFRGRNETISAIAGFGYNPFFALSYYNPWLIRKENIFFSSGLASQRFENVSPSAEYIMKKDFYFRINSINVSLGKRLDIYNELSFNSGFDYVEIPEFVPGLNSASGTRIDRIFKAGIYYSFDTRNLKQFPDSGYFASINFLYRGFGINNIDYSGIKLDYRQYEKIIGYLTGKWRVAARFTFGDVPFYDYSFIGYDEVIRGHRDDIREGHHLYTASVELKYPIIREWDFKIKLPVIPEQLTSYRIAFYINAFANTGAVQFRDEPISVSDFYSGYGGGLIILILPYNIVRFEIALDEYRNKEFIFALGFSF